MTSFIDDARLALLATAIATSACENKQEAAQQAQNEADQEKAKAQADSQKAQAQADNARADMMADFAKKQSDYRVSIDKDLVDIDRTIADLRANAATATGATKSDVDNLLGEVTTRREAVRANLVAMMSSAPADWDTTKSNTDKSMGRSEGGRSRRERQDQSEDRGGRGDSADQSESTLSHVPLELQGALRDSRRPNDLRRKSSERGFRELVLQDTPRGVSEIDIEDAVTFE